MIPKNTEATIRKAIGNKPQEFIDELVQFGMVRILIEKFIKLFFLNFRSTENWFVVIIIYSSKHFEIRKYQDYNKNSFSSRSF